MASYAVLGRTSVTNSGPTIIAGNVGASAGGVTGDALHFVIGEVRTNDALARQAQEENAAAYAALATLPCTAMIDGALSGKTFGPGVYCLTSPAVLSETLPLTIDADGNPDGSWIFRTDSLTTAPGALVQTTNGAKEGHVFWRVAGPATFGARSVFLGNVLALGNITANNRAIVSGRLLSQTGTVTLDDAGVTICCELLTIEQRILPGGTIDKPYGPEPLMLTATGGKPPYQFAVVAGELPPDLTLAGNGALSGKPKAAGAFKVAIAVTDASGFSCIRVYLIAICGPIILSELPDPVACIFYDKTIFATGGTPPYKYAITVRKRPDGLDLLDVLLSVRLFGTPTKADDHYDFTVEATDALGCKGSRRYMGPITGGLKLLPDIDTLPEGTVGMDYPVVFEVTGGTGPFTFSFSDTIPPGLLPRPGTLPSTPNPRQTLSGKPTMCGYYRFTVTVTTDACSVTRDYNLLIRPVPVITFSPDSLPPGRVCTPYCETISVNACTNDYVFAALPAGVLPPDLVFDPTTGKLYGTPKKPDTYLFTIVAIDPLGNTASHPYELKILCPTTITVDPLRDATACVVYKHQLTITGCDYPVTFSEIPETPLPGDLDVSDGGLVSGPPPIPGCYSFDVLVTPKDCPPITVHLSLRVHCVITISPTTLPSGRIGKPYSQTLSACGGTPPYIFSIVPGSPPPPSGLTLMANGTLSGTPTNSGCFTFRVRATDSKGCIGEQTYTVCILPAVTGGIGAPVLSEWGMMLLALFLAAAGILAIRR